MARNSLQQVELLKDKLFHHWNSVRAAVAICFPSKETLPGEDSGRVIRRTQTCFEQAIFKKRPFRFQRVGLELFGLLSAI